MTAILTSNVAGGDAPRAELADHAPPELERARAMIRDGLLMVFGPDHDPIPPQTIAGLAREHPGGIIAYEAKGPVSLDRLVRVLEAQSRGSLANGACDDDSAAWIEAMLGLDDAPFEIDRDTLRAEQQDDHAAVPSSGACRLALLSVRGWPTDPPDIDARSLTEIDPLDRWVDLHFAAPLPGSGWPEDQAASASHRSDARQGAAPTTVDVALSEPEPRTAHTTRPGNLELPSKLHLGDQGVLSLGCFRQALAQVPPPILYARIEGVPEGALLTAGRHEGPGSWSLTETELAQVSLVAARPLDTFQLTLLITSGEAGDVRGVVKVEPPARTREPSTRGVKDEHALAFALEFQPPLSARNDPASFALVRISGVPADASLSTGLQDGKGIWEVPAADLEGLHLRLPPHPPQHLTLVATAIAIDDRDGTFSTISQTLEVAPSACMPAPTSPKPGHLPGAIPLELQAHLADVNGEEGLTALAIGGIAGRAKLSAGTFDDETGSWILRPNEVAGVCLLPDRGDELSLPMQVKVTEIRVDPANEIPFARSTVITLGDAGQEPVDLPARQQRPGGIGFFRPLARRCEIASS